MKRIVLVIAGVSLLSACSSLSERNTKSNMQVKDSFLLSNESKPGTNQVNSQSEFDNEIKRNSKLRVLRSAGAMTPVNNLADVYANELSDEKELSIALNKLSLSEFLNYIFGELLELDYVLGENIATDSQTVTLNLNEKISKRRLLELVEEILLQRRIALEKKNNVYFIHQLGENAAAAQITYGYGKKLSSIPNVPGDILQIVPLQYELKNSATVLITQISKARVTADPFQGVYFVQGKREDVVKATEFLGMLDTPSHHAKYIGIVDLTFLTAKEFSELVSKLLANEGINTGVGEGKDKNVVLVPLDKVGKVAIFSNSQLFLDRVNQWANELDQPQKGESKRYFVFQPEHARASDLLESLAPLLGGSQSQSASGQSRSENNSSNNSGSKSRSGGISQITNDKMSVVVDARSNALIVHSSGEDYQSLLPLIKRLDIIPKQVVLEVMIAEVTLKDEFQKGVDFALNNLNGGDGVLSTAGASFAKGTGLVYSLTGVDGTLDVNFFEDNSLVNVLSRPTLVVRDGVAASMSVGDDIPVVGSTTQDPIGGGNQTTQVQYRKTGIQLGVTPTVNSRGVVTMEIELKISNTQADGVVLAGSVSVFERTVSTEVVANTGQTIMLGGLIREDSSMGTSKVPVLGDVPVLGHLFKGNTDNSTKTELIIFVTPKIIENSNQWEGIIGDFKKGMNSLVF